MHEQVLDNPIWHALTSGNKHLARGGEAARCFQEGISPFVGLRDFCAESFEELAQIAPPGVIGIVTAPYVDIPAGWNVLQRERIIQMVCRKRPAQSGDDERIRPLDNADVPAMLELTALTRPGPFMNNTIRFGSFHGIREGQRLAAMTGRRFHVDGFIEVSAVCTHPDFTGRGYGSRLLKDQMQRIYRDNATPYLHVRENNTGAIRLYETLGFETRQRMNMVLIEK
jgi:ribosomal protein S18 acetylase RimI-like enzyme